MSPVSATYMLSTAHELACMDVAARLVKRSRLEGMIGGDNLRVREHKPHNFTSIQHSSILFDRF